MKLKAAGIIIYFLCLGFIALFAYRRPHYNWDMLGYMALAMRFDNADIDSIHTNSYRLAKEHIPAESYTHLVGNKQRAEKANNADAFYKALPFFAVKPLYIQAIRLFHLAGFSLPVSTYLPSILAYLLIGGLILIWLLKHLKWYGALIAGLLIMFSDFMIFAARLSTPDCLSAFFLLAAFYFLLEKKLLKPTVAFLFLALLTRLDNVIAIMFILSWLFFSKQAAVRINVRTIALLSFFIIGTYILITAITMQTFGWSPGFYPSFVKNIPMFEEYQASSTFQIYLSFAWSQLITGLVYSHFILFLFIVFLLLYNPLFSIRRQSTDQQVVLVFLSIIFFRFLLYPELADRCNIAYYLCLLVLLVKKISLIPTLKRDGF